MKKKLLNIVKKIFGPRVKSYSDINKKVVFVLSLISIFALGALTYYIYDLQKPPDINLASEDIFSKGMITVGVRTDLGAYSHKNAETEKWKALRLTYAKK